MKGNEKCLFYVSSEAQRQAHISGPSAASTQTAGRPRERGESKACGPEGRQIRATCNEGPLIGCKWNDRFHIKEDFREARSPGAEGS